MSQSPLDEVFHFVRLPKPRPGDWLDERKEPGQTFKEYARRFKSGGMVQSPRVGSDTILIVLVGNQFESPIGELFLPHLLACCQAYFHPIPVELHAGKVSLKVRLNGERRTCTAIIIPTLFAIRYAHRRVARIERTMLEEDNIS